MTHDSRFSVSPNGSRHSLSSNESQLDIGVRPYAGEYDAEVLLHQTYSNKVYNIYDESDKSGAVEDASEDVAPRYNLVRKIIDGFRPNYITDHLDFNSFKVVLKSWIVFWVSTLLLVIPRTSHWIGTAAYLMQIVPSIVVAGGTLIASSFTTGVIIMAYVCYAWLHLVLAMKITNLLRGSITAADVAPQLISEGVCTQENIETCLSTVVFSGRFLTTRCTVIYIVAMMWGIVTMGMTRDLHIFLRPAVILGTIVLCISLCYGVFSPFFEPLTLGMSVLRPMGVSLALRFAVCLVVFPTSSNHQFMKGATGIARALAATSKKNASLLLTLRPSMDNLTNYRKLAGDVSPLNGKMVMLGIHSFTARLEISFSRTDLGDIAEFSALFKSTITSLNNFSFFYQLLHERRDVIGNKFGHRARINSVYSTASGSNTDDRAKLFTTIHDSYKEVGVYENHRRIAVLKRRISKGLESELNLGDMDDMAQFIANYFEPYLAATSEGLDSIADWLQTADDFRLLSYFVPSKKKNAVERQRKCNERLQLVQQTLYDKIHSFEDMKDLETIFKNFNGSEESLLARISQFSFFVHLYKNHCNRVILVINLLLSIDEHRPQPQFITYFTKSKRDKAELFNIQVLSEEHPYLESYISKRDPDSLNATSIFHVWGRYFIHFYKLMMLPHLWFWVRSGGITVVAAIPYFCRTTAGWYYSNRLIWLVIMTAISTSDNTGQTVYVYFGKLVYSFFGCLLGLVCWYISTGNGKGNYYGLSVVMAFVGVFLFYYRHFSVHLTPLPTILLPVTTVLVTGTSWVDAKYNHNANIGYGWSVAYTRFISVIIGLTISMVPGLFPKAHTSKAKLRHILANCIDEVGNIHCNVSRFASKRNENPSVHILRRHDEVLARHRRVLFQLGQIGQLMTALLSEVPITGNWPQQKYKRLQSLIFDVVNLYAIIYNGIDAIKDPQRWVPIIVRRLGWTEADLNADIFAVLHMTSHALANADALPKVTEGNISVRHLDLLREQWGRKNVSLNERFYSNGDDVDFVDNPNDEKLLEMGPERELSVRHNLDFAKFFSNDGITDTVLLLVAHILYERLDETMLLMKTLVGEKYDFPVLLLEEFGEDDEMLTKEESS